MATTTTTTTFTTITAILTSSLYVLLTCTSFLPAPVFTTISTCKSRQSSSLKDSMMSSAWRISDATGVKRPFLCALQCLREERCVSFLYNDVTFHCRLFAIAMTASDVTSPAVGYRYYDTCRAAGYYGRGCGDDSECVLANTRCFQSRCRCQEGYSFNASAAACVVQCSSYGSEFEHVPGWFVDKYSQEFLGSLSTQECEARCLQASSYTCRSFEVRLNPGMAACATAVVTKLTAPSWAWMTHATWDMHYYQRHCSL